MWELWVNFYWGQNENYSSRDSTSDSPEKLLQRSRGEGQNICYFVEGVVHVINPIFFAEVFYLSWGAVITMKNFIAFLDTKRYKNWTLKIGSWKDLTIWRLVLPVSSPRAPPTPPPPPPLQADSFLLSTLNSSQRVLKISSCNSTWFNHCGRWQVQWWGPICSWSNLLIQPVYNR